jgi:hypothetical protein
MVIALPATEIGGRMPVAIVMDLPGAALNQYDQVIAGMGLRSGRPAVPGGLFHRVTAADDGILVVEVWETKEQFETLAQQRIGPHT